MPVSVSHVKNVTIADGANTDVVRPSDWNSSHLITLNAVGSEISNAFGNGGGVTFGYDGTNVTATVATNYQAPGAYLTTAMASNRGSDFVAATAAFAGTNASGTIASDGISISVGAGGGLTNIRLSAGTTSNLASAFTFADGGGVTFGLNAGTITGSVATTYRASNDAIGLNTAKTNVTWTANSAGLSFDAGGYAGTGFTSTSIAGAVVAGTHDTAGLKLAVPAYLTTAQPVGAYLTTAMASDAVTLSNIRISAGTTSNLASAFTFANGSGVSFGLNAGTITGSVATSYRASNDAVGTNTALTAGPLAWTVNSGGISLNAGSAAGTTSGFGGGSISGSMTHNTAGLNISLSHPAWLTTALSNIRISAGTTSNLASAFTFADGSGVTFGLNAGTITGSVATSYRASNDAVGLNTAKTNVTWTVGSAGISFDAGGYAGTATAFSGTNVSATMTHNSAGFSLQLSGQGGGVVNQTGPNISAGSDSLWTSGTVTFGNNAFGSHITSNGSLVFKPFLGTGTSGTNVGITMDTNGLAINNTDDHVKGFSLVGNTAGTTTSIYTTTTQQAFSGGNGITLSGNSNTIRIDAGMNTQRFQWPHGNLTAVAALGNGSFSINRMDVNAPVSATRIDVPFLVSIASSATANTWGFAATVFACIYTKNVSTLSSLSSGQVQWNTTLASNTAGNTGLIAHAIRPFSVGFNINMSVGEYYVGYGISTNTSSVGTATTALGNTFSVMGGPIYSSAVGQVGDFTAATNTSTGMLGGQGVYSAAISTVPPTVSLSAINQTGSYYARANFGVIFRNI